MSALLVYGVTGFTGALVSRELARRGVAHRVAGRRAEAVTAHARSIPGQASGRAFGLEDPAQLAAGLELGGGQALVVYHPWRAEQHGGQRAEVRIHGPEAYVFTARSAAVAAQHVLDGAVRPGFATPAQALGTDWVRRLEGVEVQA